MFTFLLDGAMVPFTISLGLLMGLLLLEVLFALLGATLLGAGGEADLDLDIPSVDAPEFGDLDLGDMDFDAGDFEFAELDADAGLDASIAASPLSWLGIGRVPVMIWFASLLLGFGVCGIVVQSLAQSLIGFWLPGYLAVIPAFAIGLWFARGFGALFARMIPKTESQALSERHLGRRKGIVTQGNAERGKPAEVRVSDRFGNTHYLRAEPLRNDATISQGAEVLVLRHRLNQGYFLIPITD